MEVTLQVSDELAAEAQSRGLSVEEYVSRILTNRPAQPSVPLHRRSPEEVRAWLDSLAEFSDKIPPLPDTISREWIYQDHD